MLKHDHFIIHGYMLYLFIFVLFIIKIIISSLACHLKALVIKLFMSCDFLAVNEREQQQQCLEKM